MNEQAKNTLVASLESFGYREVDSIIPSTSIKHGTFDVLTRHEWLIDCVPGSTAPGPPEPQFKVRLIVLDLDLERDMLEAASAAAMTRGEIRRLPTLTYVVWR